MDRFIWIGDHCVNLDCIVRFTREEEGRRFVVYLRGISEAKDAKLTVDGLEAETLGEILKECVMTGRPSTFPVDPPVMGHGGIPISAELVLQPRSGG
jgi:hypothetical protein